MKRKIALLLVIAIALMAIVSACASTDEPVSTTKPEETTAAPGETTAAPGETESPEPTDAKKLKFGQIAHDKGIEWVNFGSINFEYACEELGVEPIIVDAQNDMEKVLAGMEDLISQNVDAVSVYSFSPDLDKRVSDMARAAGIPIVFENAIPADDVDRDSVTACTYYDIGYEAVKAIGERYPGSKFLFVMGQPGMNITEEYIRGIEAAIADGADTTMVANVPTNWTAEEGLNATQNQLQAGTEFDVIFANNEQIAQGVLSALEGANLKGEIPIVATGGSMMGIEMLKSGDLDLTLAAPTSFMGAMSAKKLFKLVNGETVEKMTYLPLLPATIDNIDDIIPWEPGPAVIEAIGGLN